MPQGRGGFQGRSVAMLSPHARPSAPLPGGERLLRAGGDGGGRSWLTEHEKPPPGYSTLYLFTRKAGEGRVLSVGSWRGCGSDARPRRFDRAVGGLVGISLGCVTSCRFPSLHFPVGLVVFFFLNLTSPGLGCVHVPRC